MEVNFDKIGDVVHSASGFFFDRISAEDVKEKKKADYVTKTDTRIQQYMEKEIKKIYPDIPFFAEEKDNENIDRGKSCWILDPADGTTNLVYDIGMSAVSLALYDGKNTIFGIVYDPYKDETYTAIRGNGAYLNGEKIKTTGTKDLSRALIIYCSANKIPEQALKLLKVYSALLLNTGGFRHFGSAALELCYVACGRADAYFQADLKPWDCAAGNLIVREAGGIISDFYGNRDIRILENNDILAGTSGIYSELLEYFINYYK